MRSNISRKISDTEFKNIFKDLNLNGYSVVKNFLKKNQIDFFLNDIKKIVKKKKLNSKKKDLVIYNLQNYKIDYINLLNNKYLKKVLIKKLNDPYYKAIPSFKPNYNLKLLTARSPRNKLDLHLDTYFPFKGKNTFMMQVVILLEDSKKENGCTIAVKGSHKSGKYSNRKSKNISFIEGNAGDLILWDSRLWHGTQRNKSKLTRWAIIATFGCWWVKSFMDITKSIPQSIYEKCNNEEKSILGFCSITPINDKYRITSKCGYKYLKKYKNEYWSK